MIDRTYPRERSVSGARVETGEELMDGIFGAAHPNCGVGRDVPLVPISRRCDPLGGGHAFGDAPLAVGSSFHEIDVAEPHGEIAAGVGIRTPVVGDPVGLGHRSIARQGDELVRHEVHRGVVPFEKAEGPVDELCDGAGERTVDVGGVWVETGLDCRSIESIDSPAVPQHEFVDLLLVEQRSDRVGVGHGSQRRGHSRVGEAQWSGRDV